MKPGRPTTLNGPTRIQTKDSTLVERIPYGHISVFSGWVFSYFASEKHCLPGPLFPVEQKEEDCRDGGLSW